MVLLPCLCPSVTVWLEGCCVIVCACAVVAAKKQHAISAISKPKTLTETLTGFQTLLGYVVWILNDPVIRFVCVEKVKFSIFVNALKYE
jgi:hypothetical protein